jgi:catecholate siderophore receptor
MKISRLLLIASALVPAISHGKENILPEVIVSQSKDSYLPAKSTNLPPMLQSKQTINKKLLTDQNATSLRDALRNVAGISLTAGEGGGGIQGDNLTIRGFSARSDFFLDGMRDFGAYYRDPFNLDSIDVVQGSSSLVFGRGSTGGVIAQNSKRASLTNKNEASFTLGSNKTTRLTLDNNHKINDTTAFRLNMVANYNQVARRDVVDFARIGVAPTVTFGLGTKQNITFSHYFSQENNTPDYGMPWQNGGMAAVDNNNFYGFKNDYFKTRVNISSAQYQQLINDNTTIKNQTRYALYERQIRATQPKAIASNQIQRNMMVIDTEESFLGNNLDINSKLESGNIKHDLTFGLGLSKEKSQPTRYTYNVASTNLFAPDMPSSIVVNSSNLRSAINAKVDTVSFYALDNIAINNKFSINAGGRFDYLRSSQQSIGRLNNSANLESKKISRTDAVFTYNLGSEYKLDSNNSAYINHSTSFNPSAENIALTDSNSVSNSLDPEKNTNYEIGTKQSFFNKKLLSNNAIFRTNKSNARELSASGIYQGIGNQRVQGLQSSLIGNLNSKTQINASYAFLSSKVTKSINASNKGKKLANVAKHSFNLMLNYKLLPQLELGGGGNYLGSRYNSISNANKAKGYTIFNSLVKYSFSQDLSLQFNVNNIFNKQFADQIYADHVVPGEGRVFLFNLTHKF